MDIASDRLWRYCTGMREMIEAVSLDLDQIKQTRSDQQYLQSPSEVGTPQPLNDMKSVVFCWCSQHRNNPKQFYSPAANLLIYCCTLKEHCEEGKLLDLQTSLFKVKPNKPNTIHFKRINPWSAEQRGVPM